MTAPASGQMGPSKASFFEQFKLFSPIYWVANWMELVERFAYYGVRVVLPVFMVDAFEKGEVGNVTGHRRCSSVTGERWGRVGHNMLDKGGDGGKFV